MSNQILEQSSDFIESKINPFDHDFQWTWKIKVQAAIMSVTIVPVRILMAALFFLISWISAIVISIGVPDSASEPIGPIRTKIITGWLFLYRMFFFFLGLHYIEIEGKRSKREEAPIMIIAPHTSMIDLIIFGISPPPPTAISAMSHIHTPYLRTISKVVQVIYVSRNDTKSKKGVALELHRRLNSTKPWPQVAIFPEGTTTNGKALITFKSGGFKPGVPVQPVLIKYSPMFDSLSWTIGGPPMLTLLWLCLCQVSIPLKITFLPVYYPNEEEKQNPILYAENVQKVMSEKSSLPCTGHSYEDFRLCLKAAKLNLPWQVGNIEFSKTCYKRGIKLWDAEKKLEEFSTILTTRKDGLVSIEELLKHYDFSDSPELRQAFGIQRSKNNLELISFRKFLIGMSSTIVKNQIIENS